MTHMSKADSKKQQVIECIAGHLLAEGLNKTGLRLLGNVAGTSDRMLIYYFGSKDVLLDEVLGAIAANVTGQLDHFLGDDPRPAELLLAQLTALMTNEAFSPAIKLWFELVGLAARGEEPYQANAKILANNWIAWIAAHLDDAEQDPGDLYAHLEGRLMLQMLQS